MGVEPWGRRDTLSVYGRVNSVYDLMKAAGITHTVTLLDNYTSNPNNNPGIKIFDRHIEWSSISFLPLSGSHKPGEYILSQGQEENNYSFEIGNNSSITPGSLTKANNFGFGPDGGFQSSVWFMSNNSNLIPSWVSGNVDGYSFDDIDGDLPVTVRRATPNATGGGYFMVYGIVNRMMFTRDRRHYMKIKTKLDMSTLPPSTPVFTVRVKIKSYVPTTAAKTAGKQNVNPLDTLSIPVDSPPEVVFEMPVLKSAFASPGSYEWIEITHPYFRRNSTFDEVGKEIEIGIFFENNIAVNVDKLVIQDQDYREYVSNPVLRNDIKSAINSNVNLYASNPLFESNYYDEPYMLTAKVRRDYQNILREGPGGSRMDLNGATGGYWKWHLAFDIDKVTNNSFYRHSMLYDWYPLKRNTPRGFGNPGNQVSLQKALDEMIVYRGEPVLKGSDHSLDQMQHMGYIPALDASQNFTADDLSDDIPLFHTIQVAASRIIEHNAGSYTYIANGDKLRAPSREEIHTMGNLAIAYGAKGLMFYMVPTRIPNISTADGSRVEATYGLFDNPGNLYNDDENAQVCRSRGDLAQVGNYRYFAVKEFTEKIKGIEKFILRSHWVNGFTGETNTYRIPGNIQWIDSIKSENSITGTRDTKAWVEAGLFKYTTGSTQGAVSIIPDTILIYLVNRFCDETDTLISTTVKRDITVSLNHLNLAYSNYSVINLSDTTNPVIASLSEGMTDSLRKFTVSLYGGEGCMLMITPTIYTGGEFREDETIYKNEVIKQTLHMKNYKLTIANGVSLEFQNSSKLIVEDGQLVIGDSVNTNKTNSIESDSMKTIFIQIQNLINTGELRQARELINGLVSGEISTSIKKKAVRLLPRTYEASEIQDLISGLLRIRQTGNLFKSTTMLLMNIDTENMATYKQEILNAGNNKMNGAGDNSELVMMIYNSLLEEKYNPGGVIDTAGKVAPLLAYLNGNHPGSEYTKLANLLFSDIPNNSPSNGVLSKQQPSDLKPESVIYEYKLFNNYPNPFNPETVVEYSVKEKSNVTLSIYDILGRKIHEVDQPGINSGRYEMRWQGTNKYGEKVSSGVYILEMCAKSLESSTEYRGSIKLLLTK